MSMRRGMPVSYLHRHKWLHVTALTDDAGVPKVMSHNDLGGRQHSCMNDARNVVSLRRINANSIDCLHAYTWPDGHVGNGPQGTKNRKARDPGDRGRRASALPERVTDGLGVRQP